MSEVTFADRKTGTLIKEKPPGESFLKFIYGNNPLGKLSLHLLVKRKIVSAIGGWYMNRRSSAKRVKAFVGKHQMELSDYIIPEGGFRTFNDFFYRKVKPECRPLGEGLVSPADGKILLFDSVDKTRDFFIKGSAFNLSSFLNDEKLAGKYEGGGMAIIRLAPVDYHRVHFSAKGEISESKNIKGHYYSVSPIALKHSLEIFCQNKRAYSVLKTKGFGDILFCEVGATMVGSIIQTYKENTMIEKGEEKGYFAFGGSTTVVLTEKEKVKFCADLLENTKKGIETSIKMGETIGFGI
jgi:phosphatidylserine decarboxylase